MSAALLLQAESGRRYLVRRLIDIFHGGESAEPDTDAGSGRGIIKANGNEDM